MALSGIAFWIIYIWGTAAALVYPLAGVLLYILVYHINPERQWWGEAVRVVDLRSSLTVVIATCIGLALRFPRFRGVGRQFPLPIVLGLLLVALAVVSMNWGYAANPRGIFIAEKIVKVMIFVLILVRCVREPAQYHLVIVAWLLGVFYIGYQAWGGVGVRQGGRLAYGLGGSDFADSSGLAVHLVAALPLIGAMFFMARAWWTRILILGVGALAVNTIILTRTRNSLGGLIAVTVVLACSLPRGYRLKGWAAIIVGILLAVQLTDSGWWDRMATVATYEEDSSAMSRIAYWRAAVRMASDHPLGIGLGNFHEVVKLYVPGLTIPRSAHSTYFQCLAELGYLGVSLLAAVLISAFYGLHRLRRDSRLSGGDTTIEIVGRPVRFHLGWHATALHAALWGYAAGGAFTTRLWAEGFWIMIGLTAALTNVAMFMRSRQFERDAAEVWRERVSPPPENLVGAQPALRGGSG